MTHMPPQFRPPTVLIDEWRRRAAENRTSDPGAAEVYDRCANELEQLDVHTEGAPAGASWRTAAMAQTQMFRLALALAAAGVLAAGFASARAGRNRVM